MTYFITTIKRKSLLRPKNYENTNMFFVVKYCIKHVVFSGVVRPWEVGGQNNDVITTTQRNILSAYQAILLCVNGVSVVLQHPSSL